MERRQIASTQRMAGSVAFGLGSHLKCNDRHPESPGLLLLAPSGADEPRLAGDGGPAIVSAAEVPEALRP